MQGAATRAAILERINRSIRVRIREAKTAQTTVENIVLQCNEHDEGIAQLLRSVRRSEGDSGAMRAIVAFCGHLMDDRAEPPAATRQLESLRQLCAWRPVLWLGPGFSEAAGYPSADRLIEVLRQEADNPILEGLTLPQVADAFLNDHNLGTFMALLAREYQPVRQPTSAHRAIARLAACDTFSAIVTESFDPLVEHVLLDKGVSHVVQTIGNNQTVAPDILRLFKLHGSYSDWSSVVVSGRAQADYDQNFSFVLTQLDLLLKQRPVLFVGSDMSNPRLLKWLSALSQQEAELLQRWRSLMAEKAWKRALASPWRNGTAEVPLGLGDMRPIIAADFEHVAHLLQQVADARELSYYGD